MSSNPPNAPSRSGSIVNGPPSAGINPPSSANVPPPTPGQPPATQNLNQIVLEYLSKKGYTRTEATLRKESATNDPNGGPAIQKEKEFGGPKFTKAYSLLENFVDDSLEMYRPELLRLLWPIFVHSQLFLAADGYSKDVRPFHDSFRKRFERERGDELRQLANVTTTEHTQTSPIAQLYLTQKYRLSFTKMAYNVLIQFLESKEDEGGNTITMLMNRHLNIVSIDRPNIGNERSLAAMLSRQGEEFDYPAEDEGIPGHNPGSANTDKNAVLVRLALGPRPLDQDLMDDVRAGLEEEDAKNPPNVFDGEKSLVDVFDERIKKEPTDDQPSRDLVPLPPPLARDVAMEIQKVKEHRDRFKIDARSGGIVPGVSVCMYTFHNTYDSINCIDFSADLLLVAAGMKTSYIQVWSLDGKPLSEVLPSSDEESSAKPSNSKKLIGHSGPVYAVSWSPSTAKPSADSPATHPRLLLSASADKTIRLWSVDGWQCLCLFRAHDAPVWDVRWGPHGHYFMSCGYDKVARIWSSDLVNPVRMFVGHDGDVDTGCWHPNGSYAFTAGDKSIRMWDIMKGSAVRMFTGHTGNVTTLECSPDGRSLASADDQGGIYLWDLNNGHLSKRMRGHGKGGIWSLSWSVESTVIVSGGADNTVRIWDVTQRQADKAADGAAKADGTMTASTATSATAIQQKKSKKDVVVTPDQISVFPTKKSPVYKVHFSRSNLILAGSAYMPEPA